jgi:RNA polymerase sigma factor (sigma-70 family)
MTAVHAVGDGLGNLPEPSDQLVSTYPPVMEPGDLVRRAADGDQQAWSALVDRYAGMVWDICRSVGLDRQDAADVAQVVWLRLVENLDRLRDPDQVGAWLATTVKRERLHLLKRRSRCETDDDLDPPDPALGPYERLEQGERVRQVAAALERLPERDRLLLRLLAADDRPSYAEVSNTLGMPIGSIGPTRMRALARLRRELATA